MSVQPKLSITTSAMSRAQGAAQSTARKTHRRAARPVEPRVDRRTAPFPSIPDTPPPGSGAPALVAHPSADTTRADWCLRGELDLMTAPVLARLVDQQLALGRPVLRLNLSAVAFCDVVGLEALNEAHRRCAEAGGRLVVVDVPAPIRRLAGVAGLTDRLGMAPPQGFLV